MRDDSGADDDTDRSGQLTAEATAVVIDGSAGRGRRAAGYCAALLLLLSSMAIILALLRALESPHPTFTRLEFLGLAAAALAVAAAWGAGAARTARIMVRLRKQGLTATATTTGAGDQWIGGGAGWVSAVRVSFTDARDRLVHAEYRYLSSLGQERVGGTIQITYDPANPTNVRPLDRHSDPCRAPLVIDAVLMLTYLGITLYFAYRG